MKRTLCLLLFLSLALTGCAAAAPRFDLAAGEIAAAEGLTLHMPQAELPDPWTDADPSLADIEYAGLDFAAEANFADGELTSPFRLLRGSVARGRGRAPCGAERGLRASSWSRRTTRGISSPMPSAATATACRSTCAPGAPLSFRIYYLPEMPGYEWV